MINSSFFLRRAKPIHQIDLEGNIVNTFWSTMEAWEHLKLDYSQIAACARWLEITAGWFKWRYMDEKDIAPFVAKNVWHD